MKKLLSILFLLVVFNSCNDSKESAIENNYFDLSTFMNAEIARLHSAQLSILKTAIVNGKSEEHHYPTINWKREFESFYAADIHKNSLNEKYLIDTIKNTSDSSDAMVIRYVAKEEELKTRVLEIHFNQKKNIELIKVELFSNNIIANMSESLIYYPGKFYSITNTEESNWFGNEEFVIEGRIEKKENNEN